MKGRGCAKPTIELVKSGPSLILKFQNEAWSTLDQLNGGCVAPPTFPIAPLGFEYLALLQVYTFFWLRLYFKEKRRSRKFFGHSEINVQFCDSLKI